MGRGPHGTQLSTDGAHEPLAPAPLNRLVEVMVDFSSLIPVAVAILGVLGVALSRPQLNRGRRARIDADLEILSKLPEDSPSKRKLTDHIDKMLDDLITREEAASRDAMSIGIGLFFVFLGGYVAYMGLMVVTEWWRWILVALSLLPLVFGVAGLAMGLPKKVR